MSFLGFSLDYKDTFFGFLTPPMLRRPSYIIYTIFFKFCFTVSPKFHQYCYFWCLAFLTECVLCHILCVILLNDIMHLYMLRLGNLAPERSCYVFYATRYQIYRGLTHVDFCWSNITNTHTQKDTYHTQGPMDWQTQVNMYYDHLTQAHNKYLYYTE